MELTPRTLQLAPEDIEAPKPKIQLKLKHKIQGEESDEEESVSSGVSDEEESVSDEEESESVNDEEESQNEEEGESDNEETEIVADMLSEADNRPGVFELIASDPKYFIDLIYNYKEHNGQPIDLPYLFNIKRVRDRGRLIIKFKFGDDDRWEEVGYESFDFSDEDVYHAFSQKVELMLRRPKRRAPREHLVAEMGNGAPTTTAPVSKQAPTQAPTQAPKQSPKQAPKQAPQQAVKQDETVSAAPSQGNQSTLSKVDRYNIANGLMSAPVSMAMPPPPPNQSIDQYMAVTEKPMKKPIRHVSQPAMGNLPASVQAAPELESTSDSDSEMDEIPSSSALLNAFKRNLQQQLRQAAPYIHRYLKPKYREPGYAYHQLKELQVSCPEQMSGAFNMMLKRMSRLPDTPLVSQVLNILPHASQLDQYHMLDFLWRCSNTDRVQYTEEQLIDALNLDSEERQILRTEKISLVALWEQIDTQSFL